MRLKTIKLVGFKSFVDPTTLVLHSNLTAIAGPNGCGKSNIIDAVRWVIGESSAKQLRGELLTDVIFNGSGNRKPVGQAAIELLFDNSENGLGGIYANYATIAIRREITREGHSQFYLNGSRCRRRDITDIFLGTGLGPSSYAIIEQGVISQLIESKPDELRVFLEEAAGISRYRERRRETENRIRNTRENLDRLADLREEIAKQLEHLHRQAQAAERYKAFKEEQRLVSAQLHTLHFNDLETRLNTQRQALSTATTEQTAQTAEHARLDAAIAELRTQQSSTHAILQTIQEHYYQLGATIARQQQHIQHCLEREQQFLTDLHQLETTQHEAEQNLADDQQQLTTLSTELIDLAPAAQLHQQQAEHAMAAHQEAEQQLMDWQSQWDAFQTEAAHADRQAHVEQTRLQHSTQKIQALEQQIQRLTAQRETWDFSALTGEIAELTSKTEHYVEQIHNLQQLTQELIAQIQHQRTLYAQHQALSSNLRNDLQQLSRQQASLEALQKAALGQTNHPLQAWLTQHHWQEKPRLIAELEVTPGWEMAVETVLASYLDAVCTDNADDLLLAAQELTNAKLTVFNTQLPPALSATSDTLLASKVSATAAITDLLAGIYVAETAQEAAHRLSTLNLNESIITRDGIWFGRCWVKINKNSEENSGVLQRKITLEALTTDLLNQQQQLTACENQLQHINTAIAELESQRDNHQQQLSLHTSKFSEFKAQLSAKQAQLEQWRQREAAVAHELAEQTANHQQSLQQKQVLEAEQLTIAANLQQFKTRSAHLLALRDQHKNTLHQLRERAQTAKQTADDSHVRVAATQNQLHYLEQNSQRVEKQLLQLAEQQAALVARHNDMTTPMPELESALADSLNQQILVEKELASTRNTLSDLETHLQHCEKQRADYAHQIQVLRDQLEHLRIEQSTTLAHQQNHQEQIQLSGYALTTLSAEMPASANATDWQARLTQLENRIQRLGAINLAAIDEHHSLTERKTHLDAQDTDLCTALTTLEEAIRKIDRESRARLKETFEQANRHFKALFQKIFEGGHAELELTSDELLNAGVIIRAQPPGKRNALLHLLSGGEKALTAIALVFALFQLNPAPFCILDEVDAPLDEANVRRFSRLVQSMSDTVQFLFISHNKVTMEMAQQLIGVTMQEPGVSRLVAVDIDAAIAMATS